MCVCVCACVRRHTHRERERERESERERERERTLHALLPISYVSYCHARCKSFSFIGERQSGYPNATPNATTPSNAKMSSVSFGG